MINVEALRLNTALIVRLATISTRNHPIDKTDFRVDPAEVWFEGKRVSDMGPFECVKVFGRVKATL